MKQKRKVLALLLAVAMFVCNFADSGLVTQAKTVSNDEITEESSETDNVTATLGENETLEDTDGEQTGMFQDPEDWKHGTGDEAFQKELEETLAALEEQENEAIAAYSMESSVELPSAVDNSTNENAKYCPEIGDQGSVGSCQYWAEHYYGATYAYNKLMDTEVTEATTFSPRWYYANDVRGYEAIPPYGVQIFYTGMTLERCPNVNFSTGTDDGTDFPADTVEEWLYSERIKILQNGLSGITEIKEAVAAGNIVKVSTYSRWWQYMYISDTLCPENEKFSGDRIIVACMGKKGSNKGSHAVSIVGYNDDIWVDLNENGDIEDGEKGAFKIANSWGKNWGNAGYMWIAYDAMNETSEYIPVKDGYEREEVLKIPRALEIEEAKKQPEQYIVLTVNTKNRQLWMEAKTDNSAEKYEIYGKLYSYRTNGTDNNFTGTEGYMDAQVVLPFTEDLSAKELYLYNYQGDPATIKDITYVDTVKQVSYDGLTEAIVFGDTAEQKTIPCNAYSEVPYFKTFTANYTNGTVSGKVEATDSVAGITYAVKYGLTEIGQKEDATVDAEGNYSFVPTVNGEYRVEVTATDANGNAVTRYKRINVSGISSEPVIYSLLTNEEGYYANSQSIRCIATGSEGTEYKFTYSLDGGDEITIQDYSTASETSWSPWNSGVYTIKVYAKNPLGEATATATTKIHKMEVELSEISPEAEAYTVGTSITINLDITGNLYEPSTELIISNSEGKDKGEITDVSATEKQWIPSEAGTYSVSVYYYDGSHGLFSTRLLKVTVVDTMPEIQSFASSVASPTNNLKAANMTLTADVTKTNENYQYRFGGIFNGTTTYFNDYTDSNTYNMEDSGYFRKSRVGNHTLFVDVKNPTTGEVARKTIENFQVEKQSPVDSVSISSNPASVLDSTTITVNLNEDANADNYVFHYGTIVNGETYCFNEQAMTDTSLNVIFANITNYISDSATLSQAIGTHKVYVKAFNTKTSETTITYLDNVEVEGLKITKFTASKDDVVAVGETVSFTAEAVNAGTAYNNPHADYYVVKDGVETKLASGNPFEYSMNGSWTPTEPGEYTIKCVVTDYYSQVATITKDYKVTGNNTSTVYYANSQWSSAYIHYKAEDGTWTTVPGVKMETATEAHGYQWKYVIELEEAEEATVCFNNGSGSWDSQNGSNYSVGIGTYGIKNGSVAQITVAPTATPTVTPTSTPTATPTVTPTSGPTATATPTPTPAINPVVKADKSTVSLGDTVTLTCSATQENGNYQNSRILYITDEAGKTQTITGWTSNGDAPFTKTDTYVYTYVWTPVAVGTYTISYAVNEYQCRIETSAPITVKVTDSNIATVYYSTSWSNAYIHYKVGDGTWTTVPGVQMTGSTEQSEYQWKYEIDLGDADNATVCFNNGSGSWDSNNGSNYVVKAGVYGIKNSSVNQLTVIPTATPTVKPTATPTVKPTATPTVKPTATPTNKPTATPTSTPTVAPTSTPTATPTVAPTSTPTATPTVAPTATPVPVFEITSIDASVSSPQKVGTTIILDATIENVGYLSPSGGYIINFSITKNGIETASTYSNTGSGAIAEWTPTEPGTYVITATTAAKYGMATATKTMEYVIEEDNTTTVYYTNTSWSQAYIHYQVGDGTWTTVPGVKMEDNANGNGYTWKYVIALGDEEETTVCFNNGSGSWDSNSSKNYTLEAGIYGIKSGNIEELQEGLILNISADKAVGGTYTQTTFTAKAENGTAPYTYKIAIMTAGETPSDSSYVAMTEDGTHSYIPYTAQEYTVYVKVTDAEGNTAEVAMDYTVEGEKWGEFTATADDHKVGTPVILEAEYLNYKQDFYNSYSFVIEKDGVSETHSTGSTGYYVWTPTEEGIYTITAKFTTYTGAVYEKELTYEVSDGNTATIYYNTSWSNAYIHYCVAGGSWTAVPGVVMTKTSEKSGYTHKIVLDLGDAESVTVCFNNGSGTWDSNNGSNYTIKAGTYGVSNGSVSAIN